MKKVIVIGSPGAGKSTFAKELAKKTKLPLYHLDQIWWRENWTHITREEFDKIHTELLARETWIIDGDYNRTRAARLEACDTVFYLRYPRTVCFFSAMKRAIQNRGKSRSDMAASCVEAFDREFRRYIWNFDKTRGEDIRRALAECKADIHIFRSRKEAKRYLDGVQKI